MKASRATLPNGYVPPDSEAGLLEWSYVDARMRQAKHYWLGTLSSSGAPHTRPIAGMWVDGRLYLGGSPESNWARNVGREPRVCINLSEGDAGSDCAVILHGKVGVTRPDRDLATRLVAASNEKYSQGQTVEQYEGERIFEFVPEVVLAWTELANATRWTGQPAQDEARAASANRRST